MFKHNCVSSWTGDGLTDATGFRPAFDAAYPNGAYGIPPNQVCSVELQAADPTAIEADANILIIHSENPDGSPRLNKNDATTAGQRTAIINWLKSKGVTDNQLLWMKDRFAEQFGHPWNQATRDEVGKVIRYAVNRRFQ